MVFFSSMLGTTMQNFSTTFGAFRLGKRDQMQQTEVGIWGEEYERKKRRKWRRMDRGRCGMPRLCQGKSCTMGSKKVGKTTMEISHAMWNLQGKISKHCMATKTLSDSWLWIRCKTQMCWRILFRKWLGVFWTLGWREYRIQWKRIRMHQLLEWSRIRWTLNVCLIMMSHWVSHQRPQSAEVRFIYHTALATM